MGFRVAISLQQLSLSGSGMRCSQSPCSRPGPCAMLHWITVSRRPELREARVPAQDPASRGGLLSMQGLSPMGPASAWTHECSETCGEQGPETQSVQVDLCPKVPNTSALSQEPRQLLLPCLLFTKPSLLESQPLWKPMGVSSFPVNEGQCQPYLPWSP